MIKIDINSAITIYLSVTIVIVMCLWIFYNFQKQEPVDTSKALKQCPYCTYIFFIYTKKNFLLCPRCKSVIIDESRGY